LNWPVSIRTLAERTRRKRKVRYFRALELGLDKK
jgi:hypothetical protein